jgi:hypothetical protein
MKEFIHTIPTFLSHVLQVLPYVTNDQDIFYNDCPPEIAQIRQIIEFAAESEILPSDVVSKGIPKKIDC